MTPTSLTCDITIRQLKKDEPVKINLTSPNEREELTVYSCAATCNLDNDKNDPHNLSKTFKLNTHTIYKGNEIIQRRITVRPLRDTTYNIHNLSNRIIAAVKRDLALESAPDVSIPFSPNIHFSVVNQRDVDTSMIWDECEES